MGLLDLGRDVDRSSDLSVAKKVAKPKKAKATATSAVDEVVRKVRAQLGKYADRYFLFLDRDRDAFVAFVDRCVANGIVAIDTETSGLNHYQDQLAGFSLTTFDEGDPEGTMASCYVPLNHRSYWTKQRSPGQMGMDFAKSQLSRLAPIRTVWHNAKFDMEEFSVKFGLSFRPFWDTLIGAHMLDENETHTLKYQYAKYVTANEDDVFTFGSLFDSMSFVDVPMDVGYIYAAHDTEMTATLYLYQRERLMDRPGKYGLEGVSYVFLNVEMPLIPCVAAMELRGVHIDGGYAKSLSEDYNAKLADAKRRYAIEASKYREGIVAYQKAHPGKLEDVPSYASPSQLAILFYDILKVEPPDPKKPRGTAEDVLERIGLPICDLILECRGYEKLLGTYIDKLPDCVDPNTGTLHGSFNQCGSEERGVVTGRFSSSDPKLNWACA